MSDSGRRSYQVEQAPVDPHAQSPIVERMKRCCLAVLSLVLWLALADTPFAGEPSLSAPDALVRSRNGALTVIDVRSPAEWRQTGIAAGAKPISMHDPEGMKGFYKNVLEAVGGDKDAPIAMICARGNRSRYTQAFLRERGFTQVFDISEGMLGREAAPGWLARKLPLDTCRNC